MSVKALGERKALGGCCWNVEKIKDLPAPMEKYEAGETYAYPDLFPAGLDHNVYLLRDGPHQAAECCLMGANSFEFISMIQLCAWQA